MTEMTLEEALRLGIEAHKAGKVQEADKYYTAILQAQPTHPDANHNMGVLAVGVGKLDQALPFFKKAIEANPTIEQFWISFIDALIKVQKTDEAKVALSQAKNAGVKSNTLDQLQQKLGSPNKINDQTTNLQDPPQEQLQPLLEYYRNSDFEQALEIATKLIQQFPKSAVLYNIIGAVNASLQQYDKAVEAYKKALSINSDLPEPHNNMGNAFKAQGKFDEAIEAYKKALDINQNYAEAHYNTGIALHEQNKLDDAITSYKKAINIKPDYVDALNNLGMIFQNSGDFKNAIKAYSNAISMKPNFKKALYNFGICLKGIRFEKTEPMLSYTSA